MDTKLYILELQNEIASLNVEKYVLEKDLKSATRKIIDLETDNLVLMDNRCRDNVDGIDEVDEVPRKDYVDNSGMDKKLFGVIE